ncbi:MAG: pitrilysin family protein [Pseudomonadota bacterium]
MLIEKLSNGLEVVLKENHFSKVVSIQCWIKAGALHEAADERGMAHVVEHMLFKGTPSRKMGEIGTLVEGWGGEINAYTTFERTVYYMNLISKHAYDGVDLLADAVFNSSFDGEELERELQVILEEIRRGLDDPGGKMGRRLFELCYEGNEAGRPIIGFEPEVAAFTQARVMAFHKKWYQPDNMTFVVVGDFNAKEMLGYLKKRFEGKTGKALPQPLFPNHTFSHQPKAVLLKENYQVARVEIALPAPELEHFDTPLIDLAAFALGQGDMSRLNLRLRDQSRVCSAVGVSGFTPQFDGLFTVSAAAPLESYLDCITAMAKQLTLILSHDPVTSEEISRARASLKSDRIYRDETVEGQARSVGFGAQTSLKLHFDDLYSKQVDLATPSLVESAIRRWLDPEKAIIVGMVPTESHLTESDVLKAYRQGIQEAYKEAGSSTVEETREAKMEHAVPNPVFVDTMKPGLKLIYRQNTAAEQVSLVIAARGGLSFESEKDLGMHHALSRLWAEATLSVPRDQFVRQVESLGASLHGFSGKDSVGMSMHCLADQTDEMLSLFCDTFLHPVFPEEQLESYKRETLESIKAQEDSPAHQVMKTFQSVLFEGTPYAHPVYGSKQAIESVTINKLNEFYKGMIESRNWVISIVGPQSPEIIVEKLAKLLESFHPAASTPIPKAQEDLSPWAGVTKHIPMDREQSHLIYGFRGVNWMDQEKPALEVMTDILGGHGGRLFMELREKNPLAYSVSPITTFGCLRGSLGGYIATAPSKLSEAISGMKEEFAKIATELVTEDELTRAKAHLIGLHEMDMQKADSQTMTMSLMELYGLGYDKFMRYSAEIEQVTREDIKRSAAKFFSKQSALVVIAGVQSA